MKLQEYLDALTAALLANEGIVSVDSSQNFLNDDMRRVVVAYKNGRKATQFISGEDVAAYESFEDGWHLDRLLKVITFGLSAT